MEIFSCGGNGGMAQGGLNQVDWGSSIKGMGGVGMPQPMGRNRAFYFGSYSGVLHNAIHLGGMQVSFALAAGEYRIICLTTPLRAINSAQVAGIIAQPESFPPSRTP